MIVVLNILLDCCAANSGVTRILSYGIGASSVAKSYSGYVDAMVDNKMSDAFRSAIPMDVRRNVS